jgi:hypothetical protein
VGCGGFDFVDADADWTSVDVVLDESPPKKSSNTPQPAFVVALGAAVDADEPAIVGTIFSASEAIELRRISG